jgi:NAD(P)-dependent dehydrogenase (short-subunit alcohol dehydrogenase family)
LCARTAGIADEEAVVPTLSFDGRVAVVTGAGRGLGRAYAMLLADRGAGVVVNDLGGGPDGDGADPQPALQVVEEIVAAGGRAVADNNDVASSDGGNAVIGAALEAFGRIDIVVNNAGIMRWQGLPEVDDKNIDRHYAVHVRGSFNTVRAAWPHFVAQDYGRVVMTTSTGVLGRADNVGYATAKAGVIGMARAMTAGAGERNIRVNCIAPLASTRLGVRPGQTAAASSSPFLDPEWVAPMVAYLAHEDCDVSGETYAAGAGRCNRIFLAATPGYLGADTGSLTVEDVAANWAAINDEAGYYVPVDPADWAAHFLSHRATPS